MNEISNIAHETHKAHEIKYNSNPFSRTFKGLDWLFKYNQSMSIVLLLVSIAATFLQVIGDIFNSGSSSNYETTSTGSTLDPNWGLIIAIAIPVILIAIAISAAVSTYINGVTNFIAWKTSRHETTTFSESFGRVTKLFWTIFVIQIVTGLKIFGGTLLFIVPGIRAALRYQMVLFPVFEENMNSKAAQKHIKSLTKGRLIEVFGIMTVGAIIPFIGLLLELGGKAVMYPELKALKASGQPGPKPHWLNYIGIIVVGGLLLIIAVIALLIFLASSQL